MPDDVRRPAEKGLKVLDEVYGEGFSAIFADATDPFMVESADHVFGEIWSRPGLSIRDRRLLCMGAVAAFGQADIFANHAAGALASGDLDADQLQEVVLHLSCYVGASNGTMAYRGALEALKRTEAK
jgi:4-carboxymuconolactone decarboxylase